MCMKQSKNGTKTAEKGFKEGVNDASRDLGAGNDARINEAILYEAFQNYYAQANMPLEFNDDGYNTDMDYLDTGLEPDIVMNVKVKKTNNGDFEITINGIKVEDRNSWEAFVDELTYLDDMLFINESNKKDKLLSIPKSGRAFNKSGTNNR